MSEPERPMEPRKPERSRLYHHLAAKGSMTRTNPELARLSRETGASLEHLFKLATGQRRASLALVKSLVRTARSRDVTENSFYEADAVSGQSK